MGIALEGRELRGQGTSYMIEQSPSLPLAFSAARVAFSSSLNNWKGVGQAHRGWGSKSERTHPLLGTFLHRFQATPSLRLDTAV